MQHSPAGCLLGMLSYSFRSSPRSMCCSSSLHCNQQTNGATAEVIYILKKVQNLAIKSIRKCFVLRTDAIRTVSLYLCSSFHFCPKGMWFPVTVLWGVAAGCTTFLMHKRGGGGLKSHHTYRCLLNPIMRTHLKYPATVKLDMLRVSSIHLNLLHFCYMLRKLQITCITPFIILISTIIA